MRRHLPLHRDTSVLLIGDAPQFFHNGQRVTALYDLELAKLGEPTQPSNHTEVAPPIDD